MRKHAQIGGVAAVALLILQGCAATGGTALTADSVPATAIPAADPALDHYIAWVPRNTAQTATVAKAVTHISLGNARERTSAQLCAGNRLMNRQVTALVGPLPVTAPVAAGGYPAWYYRISQTPGLQGCSVIETARLYHSLRRNLPGWISIKRADTPAAGVLTLLK